MRTGRNLGGDRERLQAGEKLFDAGRSIGRKVEEADALSSSRGVFGEDETAAANQLLIAGELEFERHFAERLVGIAETAQDDRGGAKVDGAAKVWIITDVFVDPKIDPPTWPRHA